MEKIIKERAKDLCSDISNILIHHYNGYGTEFAETKAVEDAEELINTIRQEMIDKAEKAFCTTCLGQCKDRTHCDTLQRFINELKAMEE